MYIAPLNYDRYFKKVFSDDKIAKRFLEDFLNVTITSFERLPEKRRMTDDARLVEFDYRCKINDAYVIIDMQQWYKPDISQRFYLYHALNSGLQLETLPKERFLFDKDSKKMKRVTDYRRLEPTLTLIWLANDTLDFEENYMAYTMASELVLNFIENDRLWRAPEIQELLKERERLLKVTKSTTKDLDFLRKNRLIFILQPNIVKNGHGEQYERWFRFAEKSRNLQNEEDDFVEFQGDDLFEEIMRRLNKGKLTEDDYEYISHEEEMWEEVMRLEQGYYETGMKDGFRRGLAVGHDEGHTEGFVEGHAMGRDEGRDEVRAELILRMYRKGRSVDEIADMIDLPVDVVRTLVNEQDAIDDQPRI